VSQLASARHVLLGLLGKEVECKKVEAFPVENVPRWVPVKESCTLVSLQVFLCTLIHHRMHTRGCGCVRANACMNA
jgi:hypothetical protein